MLCDLKFFFGCVCVTSNNVMYVFLSFREFCVNYISKLHEKLVF